MGSSSSKSFPPSATDELVGSLADMFADSMERADWHGARKPTWQQSRDHYIISIAGGVA